MTTAAFEEAVRLVNGGDAAGAERVLRGALATSRERTGAASTATAAALYELASFFNATGRAREAVAPFREACAITPPDEAGRRDRLTYQVQLGELLASVGELEEAEKALRESVAGRLVFYGPEHPGYAFGLEPLADVLLRRGELAEAERLCDEAWKNFIANGHERMGTALALRSEIVKTKDSTLSSVLTVQGPDAVFEVLMEAMVTREPADPRVFASALEDSLAQVRERHGDEHPLEPRFLSRIANLASVPLPDQDIDHELRCRALADLVDFFDRSGEPRQAILARLGLALAQSDAGDHEEALEVYEDARLGAKELGDPGLRAMVLRNAGLELATAGQRELAEKALRAAVKLAKEAGDHRETQAAGVALGIFLQHGGKLDEARGFLRRSLEVGDPTHPDAICAKSHLEALDRDGSCGCGDIGSSVAEALLTLVREELADPELVAKIEIPTPGDIRAHVSREIDPAEAEALNQAMRRAEARLRQKIEGRGRLAIDLPGKG